MEKLWFEGGGTHASAGVESVEGVMELNFRHHAVIQYPHHHLTQQLHHTYSVELSVTLWYHDEFIPGTLLHDVTLAEGSLDQTAEFLPVGGGQGTLPLSHPPDRTGGVLTSSQTVLRPCYCGGGGPPRPPIPPWVQIHPQGRESNPPRSVWEYKVLVPNSDRNIWRISKCDMPNTQNISRIVFTVHIVYEGFGIWFQIHAPKPGLE